MSHYKSLAIVAIRVIACCACVFGLLGMAYGLVIHRFDPESSGMYFYSSLVQLLIGIVLSVLSTPLAALTTKGFPKD